MDETAVTNTVSTEYLITSILIAIVPVLALLYYFWSHDKGEKEPFRLMQKAFFWGILVVIPVATVEIILHSIFYSFTTNVYIYALVAPFLLIALPEELGKFWVVKRKIYDHHKFNEIMDGITYTILASMGFAILENIFYTLEYGISTGILRAFTAVPAHALFSGIMGYYIGEAKFIKDKNKRKKLFIMGLTAGVGFHGLYDFLLLSGSLPLVILVAPLLAYMSHVLHNAINLAHRPTEKHRHIYTKALLK